MFGNNVDWGWVFWGRIRRECIKLLNHLIVMSFFLSDIKKEEELVAEALIEARNIQEYFWQELSIIHKPFDAKTWKDVFQKRVDKIGVIDFKNPHAKVELRKRLLQQAALSIKALVVLDTKGISK